MTGPHDIQDEIAELFAEFKPGSVPPEIQTFISGWIEGYVRRHRHAEREQVLVWFEQRSPQLVEAYRDRELGRAALEGDDVDG